MISQNHLPRAWNISEPVAQVFVNKDGIKSYYSFTNFPSLFSPGTATDYFYEIKIHDNDGKIVARKKLIVPQMASVFLSL